MLSDLFLVLAQTPAPTGPPAPPDTGMSMLVWMIFAFVLVYFLTIRPQRKKQLELESQIKALKTGDKVVTTGGIHGVIANVRSETEPTLSLKIGGTLNIELDKSAVARVLRDKPADA